MPWLNSIIALGILVTLVASWTLWTSALMRVRSGLPLLPAEPRRGVPWGAFDIAICLMLLIVLPLAAVLGIQATTDLLPSLKSDEVTADGQSALLIASSLASLVTLVLAGVLVMLGAGATWSDVGVSPRHASIDVLLGVVAFFMLAPAVYLVMLVLVQWFPSEHPIVRLVKDDPRLFSLSFISAVCVAPVVEEFMFRVLLQGWLEKTDPLRFVRSSAGGAANSTEASAGEQPPPNTAPPTISPPNDLTDPPQLQVPAGHQTPAQALNPYAPPSSVSYADMPIVASDATEVIEPISDKPPPFWPVLVSSTIFALLHWGHGPDPIPLFVLAVGLGYLYRQTHRALPGIVVHMLLNGVSMLMLFLNVYYGTGK